MKNNLLAKISSKLKQPYLIKDSVSDKLKMSFIYGIFVFLFLFVFQPFGLNSLGDELLKVCLFYGAITSLVIVILNIIVASFFPKFFEEQNWNTGKEIAWTIVNILAIGLANAFYTSYLSGNPISWKYILLFEFYTFMVSVLPITFIIIYQESNYRRKYSELSQDINQKLSPHENVESIIKIDSNNQNEELILNISELLFIKSADNYIEVYYVKDNIIVNTLLRNTLKSIENIFAGNENIIRCHKSYMVNLQFVNNVSGNAQGYKLHLRFTDISIPVSRKLNDFVKEKLTT